MKPQYTTKGIYPSPQAPPSFDIKYGLSKIKILMNFSEYLKNYIL